MSLTTKQKLIKKIPFGLLGPALSDELEKFTLLELLEEASERARFWSHCAVGERFQPAGDNRGSARDAILDQGFTEKHAKVILEAGYAFDKALADALAYYKAILKVVPKQHAIAERKPE